MRHERDSFATYSYSPEMDAFVQRAASLDMPVLLEGETGTGRTVLAERIHRSSSRAAGPFVPVPCGSLPDQLVERELFGHSKGAFTGADRSAPGLAESAHGGTMLIDDVDTLSVDLQPALLDLADNRRIRAVGSAKFREINVRIIATTNKNLHFAVQEGTFRRDLFYRIAVLRFTMSPLRERRGEIPALLHAALARAWTEDLRADSGNQPRIEPAAFELLCRYDWPGNLRELKSVAIRAPVTADSGVITAEVAEAAIGDGGIDGGHDSRATAARVYQSRYVRPSDPHVERRQIVEALRKAGGHQARAAQQLGMSRTTLWTRMREYGIRADGGAAKDDAAS